MQIIFLDTETTDSTPDARLVQLAYKNPSTGDEVNEYFKPLVDISIGAMSIHHITNAMVADKPAFEGSAQKATLQELLQDHTLVAHNASFDMGILKNEGVDTKAFIDTLRVARHVIDSESYKLQYLRYLLDLDIEGMAHDAWGDILVLEGLYNHLVTVIKEKYSITKDQDVYDKMLELTELPVLMEQVLFGKHRGKTFKEVANTDMGYLEWLYGSETSKPEHDQNEDLVYTLKQYINV